MRVSRLILLAGTAFQASPVLAADALKFGPPPAWVHPQSIPAGVSTNAPVSLLLSDQQIAFERGKTSTYSEGAIKIENSQGLAAGNLSLVWEPSTETVTVNKLQIRRGNQVIDVLAAGQSFTTLRRETNLDAAMLDGTLTATIQPEGLQVGDILDLAYTTERSDPVLKGHIESMFANWDLLPIRSAHAVLRWPSDIHLQVRQTPNLPAARKSTSAGTNVLDISAQNIEPLVPPKGAPARFKIGRLAEATDFATWADLANLLIPLYRDASAIPASGPLHDEVEKIRAASADPKLRAQLALSLVQDRVRYVALVMGQGGYVPAAAETTWSRRFGDCKAKTALLIGILHSLGIEAEPVLIQASIGDMVADRLPMIGLFNHVLVRAHIGAKDYWLDGTRTGDSDLDSIEVPDFGWGLPVLAGSKLVQMVPAPLATPSLERHVRIDASSGVYASAAIAIDEIYRGDSAVAMNAAYSAVTAAQRDEALRDEAKSFFDDFSTDSSSVQFDQKKREFHIAIKGTAKLNWKDGWFYVPTSSIGFDPDFDRASGALHDVPVEVSHPRYTKDEATIRLPAGFAARQKLDPPVHETLAGVEYVRSEIVSGDTLTVNSSERSIAPEVPYKEALAAVPRLRALDKDDVYISSNTARYVPTQKDLAALPQQTPASVDDYVARGGLFLDAAKYDEAIADYSKALELDPKNMRALSDRGLTYVWKGQLENADKDLTAAAAIQPDDAALLRARGLYFEHKGDWKAAIATFDKSLQSEPKSTFSLQHKASAEMSAGLFDQAMATVQRALANDPNSIGFHAARARILVAQHKTDEALREIDVLRNMKPADDETLAMIGSLYQMLGMPDRAKALYGQAITLSAPDDARSLGRKAMLEYQTGKRDEAFADSAKALALDPHLPDLRVLRANILYLRGDTAAVAAEAAALTKDNPDSDYAFVGAAKIYARLGMTGEAFKAFDRAIAISPKAYIYVNRSQIRPKTDFKARLADLDAALKVEPRNFDALYAKSEVLRDSGDYAGAAAALEAVDAGLQPQVRTQRAFLLYKAGHGDEAVKMFETIRASTTDPTELNNLCYDKATAGIMLESALQDCNEALKLSPDNPGFEDSLGMVYLKLGKLDEAIAAYSKVLAQAPIPASYLGRAFAYQRKGNAAAAQKDRAEANNRSPGIEAEFAGYGLKFDTPLPVTKPTAANKPTIVSVTQK